MKLDTAIRLYERELGELESTHTTARSLESFGAYRDRPVAFMEDVLGCDTLWSAQREIAEALVSERLVSVQSCNAAGKDHLAARQALWWVYSRGGLAVVLGPTERQVKTVVMRHEVRPAFHGAPDLPGNLYELALRVDGAGGIIAMTSTDASKLTGYHHPNGVLVIITEAQGVDPHTWEAALANTTGENDRILAVGNPLSPVGRYFEVCRSKRWKTFAISAFDHPNVVEGREVIPGAVTRGFIETVRGEYGEDSSIYTSRVLGEFPTDAEEVLCKRAWLDAAAERWDELKAAPETLRHPYRVALDPARLGPDESVLALAQGPVLLGFKSWARKDLMETTGRVIEAVEWLEGDDEEGGGRVGEISVDEIGLGGGILDRLKEQGHRAVGFNGARSPSEGSKERYLNRRAEAFWNLRRLLELGKIAIPRDELLWEELTAIRWTPTSSGKIQIESKDITRAVLGRSPDRADAVSMVFYNWQRSRRRRFGIYYPGMKEGDNEPRTAA